MVLESVSYDVVVSGTVEMAFVAGFFCAGFLMVIILAGYLQYRRKTLRSFYRSCNDAGRKEVMDGLIVLSREADVLAMRTNTLFFKNLSDGFDNVVSFLKRKSDL